MAVSAVSAALSAPRLLTAEQRSQKTEIRAFTSETQTSPASTMNDIPLRYDVLEPK